MLYQLPSGRTIEISVEQYLDMTDEELRELDCLGHSNTMELNNPFYGSYSKGREPKKPDLNDEHKLTDIPEQVKRDDTYFHNKDDD
tara:strand:+ start:138 stop:395 length:258 start_codon:yes stop_codon:yes gene_type:complete